MIRVFADANVFVAATASAEGGSALLLKTAENGSLEIVTSRLALLEAERNIGKKLPPAALKRFHFLLEKIPLLITPHPSAEEVRFYQAVIHEKDAPILAAAVGSKADYLVTLDRHDFMTEKIRRAHLPIQILTPGEFFRQAPLHP